MAKHPARPRLPALRSILIAGPTAVGKSAVALALAERIGGEIVSVDSMQVYRGLDIGTAKPSPQERESIRHHLIDLVEVTEPFDAARFSKLAHAAVADIQQRGRIPILCGGTGLYFKAFLEGLGEAPPADAALRNELESIPLPELLRELEKRDPVIFAKIDRQNPRRVVRALEVIRLTGAPFSAQQSRWNPERSTPNQEPFLGLTRAGDDLHARIDARVDAMFARGLTRETELLFKRGLAQNRTAMQAIGYRQVVEHLLQERSLEATIALVKLRTRQFARRQITWFRRQFRLEWLNLESHDRAECAADKLLELIAKLGL
jgi:tRNA dimethylallyltransferase